MSNSSDATSTATAVIKQERTPKILGRGKLLQVLGIWFGIAAAVGNTIAAGIVRAPGDIALRLPNVWLFLGVWVVGGMYALFGASSLAELGAAIPRSGGQYNFSRRALGDFAGFIVGWSDWLSTAGTNAAVAIVIAEYSGVLFAPLAGKEKFVAVGILVGFAILQWRGIKWGSGAQLFTAALKTAAFLVLVVACFVLGGHSGAGAMSGGASTVALPAGWLLAAGFMLGLQKVIYTVDGWDGIIYFGEEVKNPGRDIPRAIFGSVFSIMAIYLLLNAAVAYVLPMNEIAGNDFALGTAAQRIFGRYGDPIVRSIMVISLLSCINACQMFCSRILYSMSCDGLFFRRASVVNKGGTPVLALSLSTVVGSVFIISRKFDQVIDMLAFFFVANYTLSFFSLFWLRWKEPKMERPYRAWGYPWTTGIALVGSVLFLFGALYADRKNSRWALLMLVLSYPIFKVMKLVSVRAAKTPA
ncbi:MAG TPA: APC family permease [Candidatus Eremiobacteraceae bacterium]|nr:APC family permease [Candidatus Eremiobacteraceae bacterium]